MKIKRKGCYNYDLGWHQNHSSIVVAKAAEANMVHGKDITQFIIEHAKTNPWDFLLRAKAPRSARILAGQTNDKVTTPYVSDIDSISRNEGERFVPNITRYYVSTNGEYLTKIMTPTSLQIDNWNNVPHWYHVDTNAHKCAKKAPSGKWIEGPKPSEMPPMRRIGIESGSRITECNKIVGDLTLPNLDISYYVNQVEKLII